MEINSLIRANIINGADCGEFTRKVWEGGLGEGQRSKTTGWQLEHVETKLDLAPPPRPLDSSAEGDGEDDEM